MIFFLKYRLQFSKLLFCIFYPFTQFCYGKAQSLLQNFLSLALALNATEKLIQNTLNSFRVVSSFL
jgi:hypothetical protein